MVIILASPLHHGDSEWIKFGVVPPHEFSGNYCGGIPDLGV